MTAWTDPQHARAYAAFARRCSWYDTLARDLLRRVDLGRVRSAVDLGCGTGVLTAHLLRGMPPDARVLGADTSAAMLAEAVAAVPDPRVHWHCGPFESAPPAETDGLDLVACSAALAEMADPPLFERLAVSLAPGGTFVFNLPPAGAPGTAADWSVCVRWIVAAGFTMRSLQVVRYPMTARESAEWLALPGFRSVLRAEGRCDARADAAGDVPTDCVVHARWLVGVAVTA